jgi:predicted N-acetyltransferase YhbS
VDATLPTAVDEPRAGSIRSPVALPDGLVLRPATAGDTEAIVALATAALGPTSEGGVTRLLARSDPGPEGFLVVTDGDEVVATSVGLRGAFVLGGVTLPLGQVEYVATAEGYRNRGLIRRIVGELERRAEADGALLHLIEGIPYFYRVLGYGYGLPYPDLVEVPKTTAAGTDVGADAAEPDRVAVPVRLGTADDLDALRALHGASQARADLVRPWSEDDWSPMVPDADDPRRWLLVSTAPAADGEQVTGFALLRFWEDFGFELSHLTTVDEAGAEALIDEAVGRAGDHRLALRRRAHDPSGAVVARRGAPLRWFNARFVKVPDPLALLVALRPVLERRLAASALAEATGELTLSLYRRSVLLRYAAGALELEAAPGRADPDEDGSAGVPPDWFAALVLGRHPPAVLEERVDDVLFGPHLPVVEVLFPALAADVEWSI